METLPQIQLYLLYHLPNIFQTSIWDEGGLCCIHYVVRLKKEGGKKKKRKKGKSLKEQLILFNAFKTAAYVICCEHLLNL